MNENENKKVWKIEDIFNESTSQNCSFRNFKNGKCDNMANEIGDCDYENCPIKAMIRIKKKDVGDFLEGKMLICKYCGNYDPVKDFCKSFNCERKFIKISRECSAFLIRRKAKTIDNYLKKA